MDRVMVFLWKKSRWQRPMKSPPFFRVAVGWPKMKEMVKVPGFYNPEKLCSRPMTVSKTANLGGKTLSRVAGLVARRDGGNRAKLRTISRHFVKFRNTNGTKRRKPLRAGGSSPPLTPLPLPSLRHKFRVDHTYNLFTFVCMTRRMS